MNDDEYAQMLWEERTYDPAPDDDDEEEDLKTCSCCSRRAEMTHVCWDGGLCCSKCARDPIWVEDGMGYPKAIKRN